MMSDVVYLWGWKTKYNDCHGCVVGIEASIVIMVALFSSDTTKAEVL